MDFTDLFEKPPALEPSSTGEKPSLMEWVVGIVSYQLEMAFIKTPGFQHFETYVFVIAFFVLLWIIFTNLRWYC